MELTVVPESSHARAQEFYSSVGYSTPIVQSDVVVAASINDHLIGIVRLSTEHDVVVLRGMMIADNHQRKGVGTQMLRFLAGHIDAECHCLPHHWLESFYAQIGFEKYDKSSAPEHLQRRLQQYRADHPTLIYMKRP